MSFLTAVEALKLEYRTVIHGSLVKLSLRLRTEAAVQGSRHENMNGFRISL